MLKKVKDFTLMCRKLRIFFILSISIFFSHVSFSQDASTPAPSAKAQKGARKQVLSFEDELVEGTAQKPDLFYLFQRKDISQGRLIKLRQNFLPEMRRTTEDIQRIRGGR